MEITKNTRIAYAEIDSFIELLPKEEKEKIPPKFIKYFKDEKDKEIDRKLSLDIPLEKQNLQEDTWNLIAIIYLKYLCDDENEKKELEEIYAKNEEMYNEEIKEKYKPEKIFNAKEKKQSIEQEKSQNLPIQLKKENLVQKIINFISKLLRKKST